MTRTAVLLLLTAFGGAGCSDGSVGPVEPPGPTHTVDLDALFSPPTPQEIATVLADWASRAPTAVDVEVVHEETVTLGAADARLRVVSHVMDGDRHFGALLDPLDAADASVPVLVYSHGGEDGVSLEEVLLVASSLDDPAESLVWVIPSFRSESLRFGEDRWTSGGAPRPWDGDVDDALSLIDVALEMTPAADPGTIGVLGVSRGAGVALLMGARDPRIDAVVAFSGPSDFFDGYVRDIVEDALEDRPRDLPGVEFLTEAFLDPLRLGGMEPELVRIELLRRSPVYFADRLPAVQLHHGTADEVVAFSQAERLIEAMNELGRLEPEFEAFVYEGGGHSPLSLTGAAERTTGFLSRHLPAG